MLVVLTFESLRKNISTNFSLFVRKHHCRLCGKIICRKKCQNKCCGWMDMIPGITSEDRMPLAKYLFIRMIDSEYYRSRANTGHSDISSSSLTFSVAPILQRPPSVMSNPPRNKWICCIGESPRNLAIGHIIVCTKCSKLICT